MRTAEEILNSCKFQHPIELTFEEAKEVIKNTEGKYDFDRLNESTISETQEFETVQNRSYTLKKSYPKGTILYKGSEYETKAKIGIFRLIMTWDFRHPSNFCLNQNNLEKYFTIEI